MARLLGHHQPKGAATDKLKPTATASHSYSTEVRPGRPAQFGTDGYRNDDRVLRFKRRTAV